MAITEQTRYNMKRLHRVFAASCVALLLATVWMFAVDHRRQWKAIQRTNDRMEARMAEWRRSQLTMLDARAGRDRLRQELAEAEARGLPAAQLDAFRQEVLSDARRRSVAEPSLAELDRLANELQSAAEAARPPARAALLAELRSMVEAARFREDAAQRERKFAEARWEAAKAVRGIAVRDNRPAEELSRRQAEVDRLKAAVDTATAAHEAARDHRTALANVLREMTDAEATLGKQLAEAEADMSRLDQLTTERQSSYFTFRGIVPLPGKKWLEMPFFDAFNSPRKIDNLWSEGLEQQLGSFRRVRRFDRCTTCHQNIHKTLPGTSETPAYPLERTHEFALPLPGGESGESLDRRPASAEEDRALFDLWGVRLADEGLLNRADVTVVGVRPDSPAWRARVGSRMNREMVAAELRDQLLQTNGIDLGVEPVEPGLEVGDVIVAVDGQSVPVGSAGRPWVAARLIEAARRRDASTAGSNPDEPHLRLVVRRGVPNPYASHPRLDLFVGSSSPHKLEDFACTVCHEGQGSATEFRWASHEPNDPDTRRRWQTQYGWFDNKHWAFPMLPARLAESACLKCHHDVLELDRGAECDEPPAPQVVRGYHLIRTLGCFGCHDIDGFGESGRVGPDLRLEPNTHAAALQMKSAANTGYDKLTDTEKAWIDHLIADPDDDQTRDRVRAMIVEDAGRSDAGRSGAGRSGTDGNDGVGNAATAASGEGGLGGATSAPRFSAQVHRALAPLLQTRRQPGTLRKVGPSLRHVASKLDEAFLFDWIRDPVRFRPATRMPRAFGLWDHLPATSLLRRQVALRAELAGLESESAPAESQRVAATRNELARIDSQLAEVDTREQRLEPIEILSTLVYLRERSQPFELLNRADDTPPATFEEESRARIERGRQVFEQRGCLACHSHKDHPDINAWHDSDHLSRGPDLSDLAAKFSPARNPTGPAWLSEWIRQPKRYDVRTRMPELFLELTEEANGQGDATAQNNPVDDVVAYLLSQPAGEWEPGQQVPELDTSQRESLKELAVNHLRAAHSLATSTRFATEGIREQRAGCTEGAERELVVDGAERMTLTDDVMTRKLLLYVGRKTLAHHGCTACHDIPGLEDAKAIGISLADWGRRDTSMLSFENVLEYVRQVGAGNPGADRGGAEDGTRAADRENLLPPLYLDHLQRKSRTGFIYQKLTRPRSYDFQRTKDLRYTERLRMPQFTLTHDDKEAVITFVLGLVAAPPAEKYVYLPDRRQQAVREGNRILAEFNCRACHVTETEEWQAAFPAGTFGSQAGTTAFPFVPRPFTTEEVQVSLAVDRNLRHRAVLRGMPAASEDGRPLVCDETEFPIEEEPEQAFVLDRLTYFFDLWQPVVLSGESFQVGEGALPVAADQIARRRRSRGGALAKYLMPRLVEHERRENPNMKGSDAWIRLPPQLIGEGMKVRPDWLYDYLLAPTVIRPASVMRMPKYVLSADEASALADYFAGVDNAQYPYMSDPQRRAAHLADADRRYATRLDERARSGEIESLDEPRGRHLADAMKMVTDPNYCVTCHQVDDYVPAGAVRTKAPDLAVVYRRLRTEYVRKWIAKPTSVLPYTTMPVNIPYDPEAPFLGSTVPQRLYHGTALEQLDALVDVLMNYDQYAKQRSPVAPTVKGAQPSRQE